LKSSTIYEKGGEKKGGTGGKKETNHFWGGTGDKGKKGGSIIPNRGCPMEIFNWKEQEWGGGEK